MVKAFSFLLVAFILLLALPLAIGLGGGLFGLAIGFDRWPHRAHLWNFWSNNWRFRLDFSKPSSIFYSDGTWALTIYHHWFHFNGSIFAAIVILILAVALNKRK